MKAYLALGVIASVHTALTIGIVLRSSPNADEPAHLAAGLYHWHTGRFDAYRVNPPLVRLWSTLPLAVGPLAVARDSPPWHAGLDSSLTRLEWQLADQLLDAWTYADFRRRLVIARIMNLPFALLGGVYCWRWARDLFGGPSSWAAVALWTFSPSQLAWSATISPDIPATALGFAAAYHADRWNRKAACRDLMASSVLAGLAILAKSTWALFPLLFLVSVSIGVPRRAACSFDQTQSQPQDRRRKIERVRVGGSVAIYLAVVLWVVNLGYGFEHALPRLGDLRFRSSAFSGQAAGVEGNRWTRGALAGVRVPLPAEFLRGLDWQLCEFQLGKRSYLCGQWNHGGWWHYYLVAAVVKLPAGFLGLLVIRFVEFARSTSVITWRRDAAATSRDCGGDGAGPLLLPLLAFAFLVSSQTGFGHHFRYAFPCLPFLFTYVSQTCRGGIRDRVSLLAWGLLLTGVTSSLLVWPRCHSFFSELVGGPRRGYHYLVESNLEWGEDLDEASRWIARHPDATPVFHAVVTDKLAAKMPLPWRLAKDRSSPGWYIVSVQRVLDPTDFCHSFRRQVPNDTLGHSLRVYRHVGGPISAAGVGRQKYFPPPVGLDCLGDRSRAG